MNVIVRLWIRKRFFKTNLLMSMPILMEIVFFFWMLHMVLHIVCPLFKSQHKLHTYTDPKQKQKRKYLRGGGIELLSTHRTHWKKSKFDASSGWPQGPGLGRGAFANLRKECGRQSQRRKFLPRRNRILPPAASLEVWLHGVPVLASFLWWKALSKAWAGHRQKILTRRRISGSLLLQESLAAQNARPSFFPVCEGCFIGCGAGHRQKVLTRRNRISGSLLLQEA